MMENLPAEPLRDLTTAKNSMADATFYRGNGYQIFRGVLDPGVIASVHAFLQSYVDAQVAVACREIGCASAQDLVAHIGKVAAGGEKAVGSLTKDTHDTLSGHFSLDARLSPVLWSIPRQPGLRDVLTDVLGSKRLFLHMPPTARFVLPGNIYAGVPAHQDISYNKHMTDFVTVWVPLVPIDDECGGVKMYCGSGHVPEILTGSEKDKFWLRGIPTEGYEAEHCKIGVGDVLILNKWIIHQSMPNCSRRTRFSIDFRFFGERDSSSKHYLDMQTWKVIPPKEAVQ